MTIYSWNMLFRNTRLHEALAFIRESDADIFCLQEVPEELLPLLTQLPYHCAAAQEVDIVYKGRHSTAHILTLSRFPIVRQEVLTFPTPRTYPLVARILYALGIWGLATSDRHSLITDVETPGGPVRVFNLHLSLTHPERRAGEFELAMAKRDPRHASIACGDFNLVETPHISPLNWLAGGRVSDALFWRRERRRIEERFASYAFKNPFYGLSTHALSRSQLSHILVSREFTVERAEVIEERYGSDHHPVRVQLAERGTVAP